ncbi:MAG TPA: CocE/NonD family hydrolase [Candidatus Acidoferrales bacterium]|jgi:predicted acyl esterase|nr:CocE/NonD family hydrolase [Candidatus Acidoferrales bacterium]
MKRANSSPNLVYVLGRIGQIIRPNVDIVAPPDDVVFDRDVEVTMRDGTILRVNVFRPRGEGPFPVVMCAHPYGKDVMPRKTMFGYRALLQYRIMRQPSPAHQSAWTNWESPDPAHWTARGYAVVNCDLRGFGHSDGVGELISDQEAHDYYDLIEWAGVQPWSTGRVGLNGVSYLALSQWKVASLRPPHLAAICPWEGFSDMYRDFGRPGGAREDGFLPLWSAGVAKGGRTVSNVRKEQLARPAFDEWWAARCAQLEKIEVPALICGSFSDHGLHSRGCFEAFRRIGSQHRWLYTHRGGKWAVYYSPEALAFQDRFFDCFVKGEDNGMRDVPPVRLEVRGDRDTIHEVRTEREFPLARTRWVRRELPGERVAFDSQGDGTSFVWKIEEALELTGPMVLHLNVEIAGAKDATIFAGVRKVSGGANVPFEGSYGNGYDVVTTGCMKLSMRLQDTANSQPWRPVFPFNQPQPLEPGEVVPIEIELLPSSTYFKPGDELQLDIRGRWFFPRKNPVITGPQIYEPSPPCTITIHCKDAYLLTPEIA